MRVDLLVMWCEQVSLQLKPLRPHGTPKQVFSLKLLEPDLFSGLYGHVETVFE